MTSTRSIVALVVFIVVCVLVGASGSLAMGQSLQGWYRQLNKPPWTPPGWLFGPVWTALYIMMGVAAWLVWRHSGSVKAAALPLSVFAVQLALNALWTPIFFGLRRPGMAFAEIVFLWGALLLTVAAFWRVSRPAGLLLIPYLAWVSFAAALNFSIWRMNL